MLDYDVSDILSISDQLRHGKIGLFPCDTLLGIIGIVSSETITRIQSIKQRSSQPFLILLPAFDTVTDFVQPLTHSQYSLLHSYWPGPISFVLNKASHIDDAITCHKPTIALRLPNYSPLNFLLSSLQQPLISTSANIHGQPPASCVHTCDPSITSQLDFAYSSHLPHHPLPSTIVDISSHSPKILRQGVASFDTNIFA